MNAQSKRHIRSFVLRQGRLTKGQEFALNQLWSRYGLDYNKMPILFENVFQNNNDVVLEIGFGMGASLVEMAKNNPALNYLGIEVHQPGVGACIKKTDEENITNLKVINHDAIDVLNHQIPDNSLSRVNIFFPDPWHKARHNKRRIIQREFIELLKNKLKVGGLIHLATDWQEYAEHMIEVLNQTQGLKNLASDNRFIPRPEDRPLTKFEQRGLKLGHGIWDIQFVKK